MAVWLRYSLVGVGWWGEHRCYFMVLLSDCGYRCTTMFRIAVATLYLCSNRFHILLFSSFSADSTAPNRREGHQACTITGNGLLCRPLLWLRSVEPAWSEKPLHGEAGAFIRL